MSAEKLALADERAKLIAFLRLPQNFANKLDEAEHQLAEAELRVVEIKLRRL